MRGGFTDFPTGKIRVLLKKPIRRLSRHAVGFTLQNRRLGSSKHGVAFKVVDNLLTDNFVPRLIPVGLV